MNPLERRSIFALACVYLFRMLGLFLIMPVLGVSADQYPDATPVLIGAAIGIYGLTQAMLQIPMGMLSDQFGRKPIIVVGLVLFGLGSLICASADSMMVLIVGRMIQGTGAIASTLMALLSDTTREQHRTKAMATVGMSIGLSFMLSLVLGPSLYTMVGLSGLFYLSLLFSIVGIGFILFMVPNVYVHNFKRDTRASLSGLEKVLTNKSLQSLNVSVFLLHASLTALFVTIPTTLIDRYSLALSHHSWVYLIVIVLAFVGMVPLIVIAETKAKMKAIMIFSTFLLALASAMMSFEGSVILFAIALWCYFIGFNTLEAVLPSLVSKLSPVGYRGTSMGFFSTCQFLGAFSGGVGGGLILEYYSSTVLFLSVAGFLLSCSILAIRQTPVRHLTSIAFSLSNFSPTEIEALADELIRVQGIEDMQIFADEQTAYLKVDKKRLDKGKLQQLVPAISM